MELDQLWGKWLVTRPVVNPKEWLWIGDQVEDGAE
jgi:hypothetical protein